MSTAEIAKRSDSDFLPKEEAFKLAKILYSEVLATLIRTPEYVEDVMKRFHSTDYSDNTEDKELSIRRASFNRNGHEYQVAHVFRRPNYRLGLRQRGEKIEIQRFTEGIFDGEWTINTDYDNEYGGFSSYARGATIVDHSSNDAAKGIRRFLKESFPTK